MKVARSWRLGSLRGSQHGFQHCSKHRAVLSIYALVVCILIHVQNYRLARYLSELTEPTEEPNKVLGENVSSKTRKSALCQKELKKLNHNSSSSQHFSACLLTMDDHSILDEWLAYHYFALKLRYLVVLVDPASEIYPTALFQRWRRAAADLKIVEWKDEDYAQNATALKLQPGDDIKPKNYHIAPRVIKHNTRQRQFYIACAKHLHKNNHTWTAFLDVDEFLSINKNMMMLDNSITSVRQEPGHVLQYLQHLVDKQDSYVARQGSCINVPRSRHGGIERNETTAASSSLHIPAGFDPKNLNTLRFIHRSTKKWEMDDRSKSLLDVSALDLAKHFNGDDHHAHAAHQPIAHVCNHFASTNYDQAPLHVHHYLGTLEAFTWKHDVRRNKAQWTRRSKPDFGIDNEMQFWLPGFVQLVGNDKAHVLLQDAGKLPTHHPSINP